MYSRSTSFSMSSSASSHVIRFSLARSTTFRMRHRSSSMNSPYSPLSASLALFTSSGSRIHTWLVFWTSLLMSGNAFRNVYEVGARPRLDGSSSPRCSACSCAARWSLSRESSFRDAHL